MNFLAYPLMTERVKHSKQICLTGARHMLTSINDQEPRHTGLQNMINMLKT